MASCCVRDDRWTLLCADCSALGAGMERAVGAEPSGMVVSAMSAREVKKLEQVAQREREAAKRNLLAGLRRALREPSAERSEESAALIAEHPVEAEQVREAMAKADAQKARQEANATEVEEDEDSQRTKIAALAQMIREAKHCVVYTGAGLSTAASIPDYRGPNGLWTVAQKGGGTASSAASAGGGGGSGGARNAPCAARAAMGQSFAEAVPTCGHMALSALCAKGHVKQIISQNVDGLHMRSGVPAAKLCELHGNVFRERCPGCGKEFLRGFDVTGKSAYHRHGTERTCDAKGCLGLDVYLRDTIVYFGERVHPPTLEVAQRHSLECDLAVFIGSSLKVLQAYPYIWQQPPKPAPRKRFVIINLQPTPKDRIADLRIHARCDGALSMLLQSLRMSTPSYSPAKDCVRKLAPARMPPPPPQQPPPVEPPSARKGVKSEDADESREQHGEESGEDGLGEDGGGEDGDGEGKGVPPPRKRRRKSATWRKKPLPRAFPAEPPPPQQQQPTLSQPAPPPPPPPLVPPPPAPAPSPALLPVLPPPIEVPALVSSSAERPGSVTRRSSRSNSRAGTPSPLHRELSHSYRRQHHATGGGDVAATPPPLSSPVMAAAADPTAPPLPPEPPPPPKCKAKCGFFAGAGSDLCSKCAAKRKAEMAAWHGALGKKRRG